MHAFSNNRRRWMQQAGALAAGAGAAAAGWPMAASAAGAGKGTRLILLGTAGGPTPKKNRSAPAQVIVINGVSYVVDCGNGVARQYVTAGLKLKDIRHVFLTHQHSDHNADYGTLMLLAWATDLTGPVDAWGPPPLAAMTTRFLELYDYDIRTRIADEGRPPLAPMIHPHEITEGGLVMQDANVKVTSALVKHPPVAPALAFRFDSADRSIVISGDTAPSENLVRLAYGADVLVHEVMHLPSLDRLLATEPNAKTLREHLLASHTSTEDVGRIATEAKVKTLVLSHFVPGGYPYLEDAVWLDAVRPHFKREIIVGRDLQEI
ncbi:MBL fold metallo-hydrolase [Ralstonia mannitolilytica]|uniref:MBL fold metallo-hydrolase n=1 Tax=Ralstonia mannitolilytica TaxID=105219 RepID=UPI0005DA2BF9|nr:MBL fold metallo-hydrolase [Ralstonia mannitolilytica]AJW45999.1 beta-lactamase [Ralstonia mannitolilytica]QIF08224.1 MBL fold metallo-hydrolase [Ralstonia mannitolilytica]CAJ0726080.1 Ribonuclease BN [Ralstonia mannitolilytica]CAJ0776400.1 Ribonuclease BN [Ralstonia mannitolilytica]